MSMALTLLPATVFPFILTLLLLRWILQSKLVKFAIDKPNHRSLHTVPVPRSGGLAIMAATLSSWALNSQPWSMILVLCTIFLMTFSLVDDVRGLSAEWRFVGHSVVTSIFIGVALPSIPIWAMVILVVVIVWMTNLFNFMDGADGLAGGMALFGFAAYAVASWLAGNDQLGLICMAIVSSAAAFLLYNFHPARVFMGDVGSIPLGFLAAAIGLLGWLSGAWPQWFPLMVFSPFIVDATITLIKRLLRGEKIWQAHRGHYYQRLVQMGWGHRNTAIAEYMLMAAIAVSALLLLNKSTPVIFIGFLLWIAIYIALMWIIDKRWSARMR